MEAMRKGEIRIIARAVELPLVKDHTIRVLIANKNSLESKPEVFVRFMKAYRETIDWMYAGEGALKIYSEFAGVPVADARRIREEFDPKEMMIPDRVLGLIYLGPDPMKFKLTSKHMTKGQLNELVHSP